MHKTIPTTRLDLPEVGARFIHSEVRRLARLRVSRGVIAKRLGILPERVEQVLGPERSASKE